MTRVMQIGEPPIEVTLRRSARARRLSLRVSALDGRVSLTLPPRARLGEAQAFLSQKEAWIRRHAAAGPAPVHIMAGAALPIEGRLRQVVIGPGRAVRLLDDTLQIPAGATPARVRAFVKLLARDRLAEATSRHAAKLGRDIAKVTLRDTRSRWGSCSAAGNLMFSWRLILAPREVLDYVAAHEVAHLAQMNHSPAFWAEVAALMPDYHDPRRWLRTHGAALHRYRF